MHVPLRRSGVWLCEEGGGCVRRKEERYVRRKEEGYTRRKEEGGESGSYTLRSLTIGFIQHCYLLCRMVVSMIAE